VRIPRGQRTTPVYDKPGDYGDGHFCGLGCGYQFGVALADHGRLLQPAKKVDTRIPIFVLIALLLLSPLAHASSSQRFDREMRQLVQDYRHHIHQKPIKDYASSLYRAKCDLDLLLLESALKRYERGGATQAQVEKVFDQLSRDTENTPPVATAEVR
jgi:hypothetical protein